MNLQNKSLKKEKNSLTDNSWQYLAMSSAENQIFRPVNNEY